MDMYINEVIIGAIGAVLGGIIGYLVSASKIKYEYKRKLIHEKTRDFLNDLEIFYQPLGYYSSQLAISSKNLLDGIKQEKIDDIIIKKMLFDVGNYWSKFLDLSEKRGYIIFPHYIRKFEIFGHHLKISKEVHNLIQDQLEISSLRNISTKCENNFEKFCFELENTNIFSNFKSKLTEDSLTIIFKKGTNMYKTIDDSIDNALEPWYIAYNKKSYKNKDKYIKKYRDETIDEYET